VFPATAAGTIQSANQSQQAVPSDSSKLSKAAREFESILLASWLEKMQQSFGGAENQDPAHDTISGLGTQAIATALAERGGIGIARMLIKQLSPPATSDLPLSMPRS
jgi:Rod binding domain-containing protein